MSAAIDTLKAELKSAEVDLEEIKKAEKATIDAGLRAKRKVDDASWRVHELKSAIATLERDRIKGEEVTE